MLYNVLPPLIFFMSLGGTILVMSRVVLRVRHDQVSAKLQSHVSQVSKSRLHKVQDLAGILAPNQMNVHSFKNRISYMAHIIKETSAKEVTDIKDWRKHRSAKKQQSKTQKKLMKSERKTNKNDQTEIVNPNTKNITPPSSRIRDPLKKILTQAKSMSNKGRIVLKKYTAQADNTKNRQTKEKEQNPPQKKLLMQLKKPLEKHSEKAPAITKFTKSEMEKHEQKEPEIQAKTKEQNKTASISKFFKKDQKKDVLDQAKEALADAQVQKVEDILVPYIIKHPKNTLAYMMLGKVAISRKNWTEAAEIFEQVTRIKPDTKGCYAALGEAAYESGNLTKAIEALQQAHNQTPKNTQVIKRLIKIANHLDNQPMKQSLTEELKLLEQDIIREDQVV